MKDKDKDREFLWWRKAWGNAMLHFNAVKIIFGIFAILKPKIHQKCFTFAKLELRQSY